MYKYIQSLILLIHGIRENYEICISHLFEKPMDEVLGSPFTNVYLKIIFWGYFILRLNIIKRLSNLNIPECSKLWNSLLLLSFLPYIFLLHFLMYFPGSEPLCH